MHWRFELLIFFYMHFVGEDLAGNSMPFSPNKTPPKPLPTNEQQRTNGRAVAPAIAGRAPHKPSTASSRMMSCQQQHWHIFLFLLLQLVVASSRLWGYPVTSACTWLLSRIVYYMYIHFVPTFCPLVSVCIVDVFSIWCFYFYHTRH